MSKSNLSIVTLNLPDLPLRYLLMQNIPTLDISSYIVYFQLYLGLGEVDPIVSIFRVCDAEADDKVSMKEIVEMQTVGTS